MNAILQRLRAKLRTAGPAGFLRYVIGRIFRGLLFRRDVLLIFVRRRSGSEPAGPPPNRPELRWLQAGDLPRLVKLQPGYLHPRRVKAYEQRLARGERLYGLFEGERVLNLGWVGIRTAVRAEPEVGPRFALALDAPAAVIYDCWTAPEERGRGHYPAALDRVASELLAEHEEAWIYCLEHNEPSARGIQKAGFQPAVRHVRTRLLGLERHRSVSIRALGASDRPRLSKRALVFRALRYSGVPALIRATMQRRAVTIVVYHDPDPDTFEQHLRELHRRYSVISLRAYMAARASGTLEALPRKPLVISLDDGHRGNRALLPVLERSKVPAVIFVCADMVGTRRLFWFNHVSDPGPLKTIPDRERLTRLRELGVRELAQEREALSDEEMAEMRAAEVDFQSHTLSHPILLRCEDEKARAEIADSRAELERRYGLEIYALAYPNGDYAERELALTRQAGYTCGLTLDPGFNTARTDPYRLRRICIDDHDGVDALLVKSSGLWGAIRRPSALLSR